MKVIHWRWTPINKLEDEEALRILIAMKLAFRIYDFWNQRSRENLFL